MGKNKKVFLKSTLFGLRPLMDKTGIVQVNGRLKNAVALDVFQKQPIILLGDNIYPKLLFQRETHAWWTANHDGVNLIEILAVEGSKLFSKDSP